MPKGSILVVDDEMKFAKASKLFSPPKASTSLSRKPAKPACRGSKISPSILMLLDVSLPDRNGLELLREIRRRDPQSFHHPDHRVRLD